MSAMDPHNQEFFTLWHLMRLGILERTARSTPRMKAPHPKEVQILQRLEGMLRDPEYQFCPPRRLAHFMREVTLGEAKKEEHPDFEVDRQALTLLAKYTEVLSALEERKAIFKDTSRVNGALFMCAAMIAGDVYRQDRERVFSKGSYTLKVDSNRTVQVPIAPLTQYSKPNVKDVSNGASVRGRVTVDMTCSDDDGDDCGDDDLNVLTECTLID